MGGQTARVRPVGVAERGVRVSRQVRESGSLSPLNAVAVSHGGADTVMVA